MDLPKRKPNRIEEYDYSQNGAYFITICTQDRKQILSAMVGDDAHIVPKPAGKVAEEFIRYIPMKYKNVSVDRFVIMPDHIHILLRFNIVGEAFRLPQKDATGTGNPSPTVGNIVGWYKYQVTKRVNLLRGTSGERLFQRSYYDHVIRNQQDYDEIWEYIENNPRKWAMQKQGRG